LYDHIVRAHCYQVDADRVVARGLYGQAQFSAHPIGARHQYGSAETLYRQFKQRAEAAQTGQHFGAHRSFDGGFDTLNQRIAGFDIDTGVLVGDGLRWRHTASDGN
jgi:hypothetical protein